MTLNNRCFFIKQRFKNAVRMTAPLLAVTGCNRLVIEKQKDDCIKINTRVRNVLGDLVNREGASILNYNQWMFTIRQCAA